MVACVLVLFMQAGFLLLEIGFSRQKNVGAGVAKVLVNLAVVTLAWWAVGYGISSLTGNKIFGTEGFFFHNGQVIAGAQVGGTDTALMLFGMLFCAVSLAIVWGTTLERIRFAAYAIYAAVFGAIIYPLVAHGVYGGGLLADVGGRPVMRLRRFVGGPPDRCCRCVRGAAAARAEARQVRRRWQAASDSRSLDAAGRPRCGDPLGRLVRLQRGLDLRDDRRLHGRSGPEHAARSGSRSRRRAVCSRT